MTGMISLFSLADMPWKSELEAISHKNGFQLVVDKVNKGCYCVPIG